MEPHLYFKKMTDRQTGYSSLSIWQKFYLKWNKVNLSLQGKQLIVFVTNDKISAFFQIKIRILKNFLPLLTCQLSNTWRHLWWWMMTLKEYNCVWYCIMKCVKIRKNCLTQWITIFQITMFDITKSCMSKRSIHSVR